MKQKLQAQNQHFSVDHIDNSSYSAFLCEKNNSHVLDKKLAWNGCKWRM